VKAGQSIPTVARSLVVLLKPLDDS